MSRDPDDLLRALVRDEVRSMLRGALTLLDGPAEGFSSRRGHGPPGYEHRAWQDLARRIGVKRGRWWHVTAEALATHEATHEATSAPAPADTSSAALARRLGLRLVANGKG